MKRVYLFIIMAAIFCLSACGTGNTNGLAESVNQKPESVADADQDGTESIPEEGSVSGAAVQEETNAQEGTETPIVKNEEKMFYGHWKVVECFAPGITALSTEEMEGYVNVQFTYTKELFTVDNVSLENPVYHETAITKEEFADSYNNQITFDSLNAQTDSITEVSIQNSSAFGGMFYVVDENTLYITMDGGFFKAVRQSEDDLTVFE